MDKITQQHNTLSLILLYAVITFLHFQSCLNYIICCFFPNLFIYSIITIIAKSIKLLFAVNNEINDHVSFVNQKKTKMFMHLFPQF